LVHRLFLGSGLPRGLIWDGVESVPTHAKHALGEKDRVRGKEANFAVAHWIWRTGQTRASASDEGRVSRRKFGGSVGIYPAEPGRQKNLLTQFLLTVISV